MRGLGLQLRSRVGLRWGHGQWLLPPWIAPTFIVAAVLLLPWAGYLYWSLPQRYGADNWRLAWGGFDVGLGLALLATAITVGRRSPFAEVTAAVTGTLLVCDAWFDVVTATTDVVQAVLLAVFVELPLAALCFWMAFNLARAVETVRPFLEAAGFTIQDSRLVPPPETAQR